MYLWILYFYLYLLNADKSTRLADGNLAEFKNGFNEKVDLQDALKFTNINESFALTRNNASISIERRPVISSGDTLFFNLARITQRDYQFRFEPENLDPLLTAFLEDSYTKLKIPVSVSLPCTYNFTVNDIPESAAANRFRVIFKMQDRGPLPVTFSSIKAYRQGSGIRVQWIVENELGITRYEAEKSIGGIIFTRENTIKATGAGRNTTTYSWLDSAPAKGDNYYRIRSVDGNGKEGYSRIVKISNNESEPGFNIYPNPVKDGAISIQFNNRAAGLYHIKLISNHGQTILNKSFTHASATSTETIKPGKKIVPGIYHLEITSPGKELTSIKLIVQ